MSSDRSKSKNQHWVSQFYLRYFATSESRNTNTPQVWIFSKREEDGIEQLSNVRNVCSKRYLYSPRQLNGERSWALDDKLNDIEALLGQIWPALATDFVDLRDEHIRKALALFVSIMHMRHPDIQRVVEEMHGVFVKIYESSPKRLDGTPQINSLRINDKSYDVDTSGWTTYRDHGKDGHHRVFADTVQSETGLMAKHLLSKRWSLIASERDLFVTSDKPVVLQNIGRDRFGYGTRDTVITFPVSPRRLLVLDDRHNEPSGQYYSLDELNIASINMNIWRGAQRFLITGRSIQEVLNEFSTLEAGTNNA